MSGEPRGDVARALHDAEEFVGNVIRYATGEVKEALWEDDSLLVEQAWDLVKTLQAAQSALTGPDVLRLVSFDPQTGPTWSPSLPSSGSGRGTGT